MKKLVEFCDRCGKSDVKSIHPISIFEERFTDAAGDRDNIYDESDFCGNCLAVIFRELIKNELVREFALKITKDTKVKLAKERN